MIPDLVVHQLAEAARYQDGPPTTALHLPQPAQPAPTRSSLTRRAAAWIGPTLGGIAAAAAVAGVALYSLASVIVTYGLWPL